MSRSPLATLAGGGAANSTWRAYRTAGGNVHGHLPGLRSESEHDFVRAWWQRQRQRRLAAIRVIDDDAGTCRNGLDGERACVGDRRSGLAPDEHPYPDALADHEQEQQSDDRRRQRELMAGDC